MSTDKIFIILNKTFANNFVQIFIQSFFRSSQIPQNCVPIASDVNLPYPPTPSVNPLTGDQQTFVSTMQQVCQLNSLSIFCLACKTISQRKALRVIVLRPKQKIESELILQLAVLFGVSKCSSLAFRLISIFYIWSFSRTSGVLGHLFELFHSFLSTTHSTHLITRQTILQNHLINFCSVNFHQKHNFLLNQATKQLSTAFLPRSKKLTKASMIFITPKAC